MIKHFVLDTNVLLHSAVALDRFDDNVVVLPLIVIEELDRFKKNNDELGRNARAVIRRLDKLRVTGGDFRQGIPTPGGGLVKVLADDEKSDDLPFARSIADNRIIAVAYHLQQDAEKVIIVSKDANVRVKAALAGLNAEDYDDNFDRRPARDVVHAGWRRAVLDGATLARLKNGEAVAAPFADLAPNECVIIAPDGDESPDAPVARARPDGTIALFPPFWAGARNIAPRSPEQSAAFGLLHDPEVAVVTLSGQAGTGKTLLALAVGLEAVLNGHLYEKLLVSRPIMPLGKDIGFLPGDKDDKLGLWMQPIYDNLAYLMRDTTGKNKRRQPRPAEAGDDRADKNARGRPGGRPKTDSEKLVEDLLRRGVVELEAITYIRGRSIPNKYVIVDEAQNLTPHEVKTIISRAGQGTKIVLTGDPEQIDNPFLDSVSNGLSVTIERFRSSPLAGHITLTKSERSPLASLAARLL